MICKPLVKVSFWGSPHPIMFHTHQKKNHVIKTKKLIEAGFMQEEENPDWVASIVPVFILYLARHILSTT